MLKRIALHVSLINVQETLFYANIQNQNNKLSIHRSFYFIGKICTKFANLFDQH